MEKNLILAINPGSTSTKIGIFRERNLLVQETLRHTVEELNPYPLIIDQYEFRYQAVKTCLLQNQFDLQQFAAIVGRGGMMKPIAGGTYLVNDAMKQDLRIGYAGQHASNLGGLLADAFAVEAGVSAYIVDPVVVDEMQPIARYTGIPVLTRRSVFHALNQKAVAYRAAKSLGKSYTDSNFIVAHLGGGISVAAHACGRVIDTNNALDGDGPFSPERAGSLPVEGVIRLAYSGKYTEAQLRKYFVGHGGLIAYLGTNDGREIMARINNGDLFAKEVFEAMAYQISKAIGAAAAVLDGKVDAVLLTGGLAYSKLLTDYIQNKVRFIAPVKIYPGEDELLALAEGALRVLQGQDEVKIYV